MSRLFKFLLAALALSADHQARAAASFPTALGTSWSYQVVETPSASARPEIIKISIAGTDKVNGYQALRLQTRTNDQIEKTEFITVDQHGVFCLRRDAANGRTVSFQPPLQLIPAELKVGTNWELDDELAGEPMHQRFTVAAEGDVTVPAGTFHAYRFDCDEPWPLSINIQRWFAPGTGIVKEITTTRGPNGRLMSRVTSLLQVFSPGVVATVAATPAPNDTPSVTVLADAPVSPQFTLVTAKEHDGQMATDFPSDAPNIFVRWNGVHLPVGETVRVDWVAEDVGDIVSPNFIVDQRETVVGAPSSRAQFTLSRPKDGWAPGKYRVDLHLNDKLVQSVKVTIAD